MSREIKRVAIDFRWPLRETWKGFLMPDELSPDQCPDCDGRGYSPEARHLHELWYGYAPFAPEDNGSTPLTPDTPAVRAFAERNVTRAPEYYGSGEVVIQREARRLADLFNSQWSHHLNEADVAALVEAGRLKELTHTWSPEQRWQPIEPPVIPTPEDVNTWAIGGFGHDAINASVVLTARCTREGVADMCATCDGQGSVWRSAEQKAAHDAWKQTEPPEGEGWQVWETVSEGSPVTPVFSTRELLIEHLCTPGQRVTLREGALSPQEAEAFVAAGWVPSFIGSGRTGLVEGALAPGVTETLAEIDALPTADGGQ